MKGKSVLTSQQIAHVLALHLAERSLFIEELALLTGNVLPASDERWRELERLGLAERVSSPHGTAWKAGDETAAFIRSQLPLLKDFFRPSKWNGVVKRRGEVQKHQAGAEHDDRSQSQSRVRVANRENN